MRRPNILILYTDQQRWDALGANGNSEILTPNLDQLAQQGVNFDHYFVQNPVCMPSRVSFLTGQYPSKLGITHMGVPVPQDTVTLAHLLKPYGYRSANIGKLHFLPHANRDHRVPHPDYGFDHLEIADEPGPYEDAYRAWVRREHPDQVDNISLGLPPMTRVWYDAMKIDDTVKHRVEGPRFDFDGAVAFPGTDEVTHSAFVAEQTINFLQQQSALHPFLCIAGFYSPHSPWVVPQRFLDMYDPADLSVPQYPAEVEARRDENFTDEKLRSAKHGYYAMITEVDYHVGRILETLAASNLADDTIVIFTSDHGEWLGDHLRYGKGYPGPDVVSRVPFIVRWPNGGLDTGQIVHEIVEAVDVVPTLMECAGMQIAPHLQGESFYNLLHDSMVAGVDAALMEATGWKQLRTRRYRYVIHDDGREWLWDLENDPLEYVDIAGEETNADILAEHRHLLLQKLLRAERPRSRIWPY